MHKRLRSLPASGTSTALESCQHNAPHSCPLCLSQPSTHTAASACFERHSVFHTLFRTPPCNPQLHHPTRTTAQPVVYTAAAVFKCTQQQPQAHPPLHQSALKVIAMHCHNAQPQTHTLTAAPERTEKSSVLSLSPNFLPISASTCATAVLTSSMRPGGRLTPQR